MTFPEDYPAEKFNVDATFAVTVKAVKTSGENRIDDEFASRRASTISSSCKA